MRLFSAAVAAALLSIGIVSSAWAGDLLFTASEIAAIKAYYAREDADADVDVDTARANDGTSDVGARTGSSRDHRRGNRSSANHGKGRAGKGGRRALPPGIAKNLARGKPLPPGIAMQTLPDDLAEELPPPPTGCERIIVDGKVVLIDLATRVVHDIISDIVYR